MRETTKYDCIATLQKAGIAYDDARALRRISMTLHRWHELECGDGNDWGSWCITRGRKLTGAKLRAQERGAHIDAPFLHDDDGKPHLEWHHYLHGRGEDYTTYSPIPDREKGARKRLGKIMARYPGFVAYVQTDPRGCALYVLRPGDLAEGADVSCCYSRGIAVYK